MQEILTVEHLYVIYNKKNSDPFVAVKDFSYQFQKGKIYCIVGQSGSGKSTLINCFNGLNPPDYGRLIINQIELSAKKRLDLVLTNCVATQPIHNTKNIYSYSYLVNTSLNTKWLDVELAIKAFNNDDFYLKRIHKNQYYLNTNLTEIDINPKAKEINNCLFNKKAKKHIKEYKKIRKNVGIVYQFPEFQLFKPTVIADVSFGLLNMKVKKDEALTIAKETLTKLGINSNLFNNSPFCLSGGQKRKVALAGIFSINPNIYVFDEPTAGLDPASNAEMVNYMLDFKKQDKCVIVVTHSMDDVLLIADEILVIHDGKLVLSGEPYDIFLNKDILKNSRIELPLVINLIKKLINKDARFNSLLQIKPRNIQQLSDAIVKILKGKKNV